MKIKNLFQATLAAAVLSACAVLPVSAASGTVTADLLTVRTGPSTNYDAVSMLSWGDFVDVTYEPGNGWYEIYLYDGCYYVSSDFVSLDGSSSVSSAAESTYTDTSDESYTINETMVWDESQEEDADDENSYTDNESYADEDSDDSSDETVGNTTYLGNFTLTAYCGCAACCGSAGNLTASGTVPTAGRTVAMGGVEFGTRLLINGHVYTVEDRGTSYGMVDIFFDSHSDAIQFGMQSADVYLVN